MHDALWMDNNFNALHLDSEKPVRLDHLEPFVEQRCGIDCDLWSHVPGRMLERLLRRDRIEFIAGQFTKWSTGCGENNATNISGLKWGSGLSAAIFRGTEAPPTLQTLKNRVVLAVHRQNMHIVLTRFAHHDFACHYQNFLARDREIFSGFNRGQ